MGKSRLNNSIKNLKAAWIGQFLNIFAKFVMRRFFVRYISDAYLGLDAVFTNIIGLMNLAEMGIGYAVVYVLYRPLVEQDEEKIIGVMQLLAKVYKTISLILCGIGLLLMPLITIIAPEARNLPNVHLLFGFYLANTCVSYLFTYKGLLATADQKNYITLRNHYVFIISLNVVQTLVIYFTHSFAVYAALQTLFTFAEGISLSRIMNRRYPILRRKDKVLLPAEITKRIWSDTRKMVIERVGSTLISSTDNLILSNVVGLSQTGVYSNYVMVKEALKAIMCQFLSAVSASIGNLAASGEHEKEMDYFWLLNFMTSALYSVTAVCMFNLVQPFIALWLGGSYIMDYRILFCLTVIYFLGGIRGLFGTYSMAHGIFDLNARKTILEAIANLVLSIVLVVKFRIIGVLLGTIISSLFVGLPLELFNVGRILPEISKKRYVLELFVYSVGMLITLYGSMKLCNLVSMHWYIRLPLGFLISIAVFIIVWWLLFGRTEMYKRTVGLIKEIIVRKFTP